MYNVALYYDYGRLMKNIKTVMQFTLCGKKMGHPTLSDDPL
jgi:hypothetical protein